MSWTSWHSSTWRGCWVRSKTNLPNSRCSSKLVRGPRIKWILRTLQMFRCTYNFCRHSSSSRRSSNHSSSSRISRQKKVMRNNRSREAIVLTINRLQVTQQIQALSQLNLWLIWSRISCMACKWIPSTSSRCRWSARGPSLLPSRARLPRQASDLLKLMLLEHLAQPPRLSLTRDWDLQVWRVSIHSRRPALNRISRIGRSSKCWWETKALR